MRSSSFFISASSSKWSFDECDKAAAGAGAACMALDFAALGRQEAKMGAKDLQVILDTLDSLT